jgi:hypothetical protein
MQIIRHRPHTFSEEAKMSTNNLRDAESETLGAFTVADFLKRFGIGTTMFYAEIKSGRLKCVKAGRRTLILYADAKAWADALSHGTISYGMLPGIGRHPDRLRGRSKSGPPTRRS